MKRVIKDTELHAAMDVLLAAIQESKLNHLVAVAAMKIMCASFEKVNGFTILIEDKEGEKETIH
jgi:hypothetical protein